MRIVSKELFPEDLAKVLSAQVLQTAKEMDVLDVGYMIFGKKKKKSNVLVLEYDEENDTTTFFISMKASEFIDLALDEIRGEEEEE